MIVGGAGKMEADSLSRLQRVFTEIIAPLAQTLNATVIDGGTDCGVMQLMGQARHEIAGTFPLIGVSAIGTVILPDGSPPPSDEPPNSNPTIVILSSFPVTTGGGKSLAGETGNPVCPRSAPLYLGQ